MKPLLLVPGLVASAAIVAEVAADPISALPWIERLGSLVVVAATMWWLFTRTIPSLMTTLDNQRQESSKLLREELDASRKEWRDIVAEIRADRELDREARHETNRQLGNLALALEVDVNNNETPPPRKRG